MPVALDEHTLDELAAALARWHTSAGPGRHDELAGVIHSVVLKIIAAERAKDAAMCGRCGLPPGKHGREDNTCPGGTSDQTFVQRCPPRPFSKPVKLCVAGRRYPGGRVERCGRAAGHDKQSDGWHGAFATGDMWHESQPVHVPDVEAVSRRFRSDDGLASLVIDPDDPLPWPAKPNPKDPRYWAARFTREKRRVIEARRALITLVQALGTVDEAREKALRSSIALAKKWEMG